MPYNQPQNMNRLTQIRCLICDVDGVLTDGGLYYTETGEAIKRFHVHDGLGLQLLMQYGIHVAIISGRHCAALSQRLDELNITHRYLGQKNKQQAWLSLLQTLNLSADQVAYVGDDLNDLGILQQAGLPITVADAPAVIAEHCQWVTQKKGGHGAIREVCDAILKHQGHWPHIIASSTHQELSQ